MTKEKPLISIIIVNYNSGELLLKTVKSILKSSCDKDKIEVIIVDNNSKDHSIEILLNNISRELEQIYNFILIENHQNEGWCKAINKGIKLSKGKIIIFSNHDIVFTEFSIDKVVNFLLESPQVGICQFYSLLPTGKPDVAACYLDSLGYAYSFLANYPLPVTFAEAMALALKRKVVEDIGNLDEDYFIEYEDQDFCWRALLRGYKVFFLPDAVVYHYRGSVEKPSYFVRERRVMLYTKNHIITLIKNLDFWNLVKFLPLVLLIELIKLLYILIIKRNLRIASSIIHGILSPFSNLGNVLEKRMIVQREIRKVSDKDVLKYMSPFRLYHQINYLKFQQKGQRYIITDTNFLSFLAGKKQ